MADNSDLVLNHIGDLYRHRNLVTAAYRRGAVDVTDDPEHGRGLTKLNQTGVLIPLGEGSYRLASSLSRYFDEVLRVDRLYLAVGADVAELDQRLPSIAALVAQAVYDGRVEDAQGYADEFERAVFALSDSVTAALQLLRALADNRFANVSTYAEKRAQNEFYLGRVQHIGEALGAIQSSELQHTLEAMPDGERMLATYRSQIVLHLSQWRAQLLDITAIMREYLFRMRQIEQVAKRMRAFELYLKRTPSYVPPEIELTEESPNWARLANGIKLKAHAWIQNPVLEELFFEIASSIPAAPAVNNSPPRLGTLLQDEPAAQDDEVEITRAWQGAISALFEEVTTKKAVSAVEWKAARSDIKALPNDIWLLCLLHEDALQRRRASEIRFDYLTSSEPPLSGMIHITDIILSRVSR